MFMGRGWFGWNMTDQNEEQHRIGASSIILQKSRWQDSAEKSWLICEIAVEGKQSWFISDNAAGGKL